MQRLCDAYGPTETIPYHREFVEIEQYRVFQYELTISFAMSLAAVAVVVTFITMNLHLSLMIILSIVLVDYYLIALIYFWGLTINMFTGLCTILSLGIAVDYSTHIAHTFLLTEPPASCKTNREKRYYKAIKAISQMGSSIFHGAMSTILSLVALAYAESFHI